MTAKDEYEREIFEDEYGQYTIPTTQSIYYYIKQRTRMSRLLQRLYREHDEALAKHDKYNERVLSAMAKRAPIADGQDIVHIAPVSRKKRADAYRRLKEINHREDVIYRARLRLDLRFQAEIARVMEIEPITNITLATAG